MKKIFTFLVVLVSTLSVFAADFKSDNLWYTITGVSTVEVAKHSDHKSLVSVTVPKTVSDGSKVYTVTEVGEEAFAECHTLATVVLPEGVIELGGNAFEACENLVSVSLPEGLQTIGMNAFLSCDHLASVVIPNSVTSVGINAFNGCSALKSVELSENLQEIESGLFNACEALDYIVIPSSVTSIGKNAFYGCEGLDSIKCLGIAPATLVNKTNVFKNVDENIPVYVPCIAGGVSSVDAYNATDWAKYFKNIQEPRPIYTIHLSANDAGYGTAKIGKRNTECGVEIVAVPNTGYEFAAWSDSNKVATRTLVLDSDSAMKAIFKPMRYTIKVVSADANHGTAKDTVGDYNTNVKILANHKFGYRFNYWNDGNQDNPRQVLVLGEATYTAYFKEALVKDTIKVSVCDNTTYVDPITGKNHEIKSATPASLIWNDSVWTALDQKDTLYTFVVTPLVAPKLLEQADLEDLPGAVPVLVPGYEPDTIASVAAILKYYQYNDDEKTADVVSVKWNYSGKVKCDDTSFAMALIVKDTCGNELKTACDFVVKPNIVADTIVEKRCGEYTWGVTGLTYDKSGIYTHTVKSDAGCDSVYHVLDLKVWGPDTTVINETVCYGTKVNGEKLTEDKVIEEPSGKTIHGCDSMTVYKFTVLPAIPVDTTKVTICAGESYTWEEGDGETYTTKTSIFVTKKTINGCDSILALELTVLPQLRDSIIRDTLCYGKTYTWTKVGKEYTGAGEFIKDSTTYQSGDCYGKLYLELTCWPEVVNVVTDTTICCGDSITWNGRVYYEEGTYTIDTVSVSGCDSVATLNLTVLNPTKSDTTFAKVCYGGTYEWNGKEYGDSGTYPVTMPSKLTGCDSVAVLELTVLPEVKDTVYNVTICAGADYEWEADGNIYTGNITNHSHTLYTSDGCPYKAILNLTELKSLPDSIIRDTLCYGASVFVEAFGKHYTNTGLSIKDDTTYQVGDCYGNLYLDLLCLPAVESDTTDATICYGDSIEWNGRIYKEKGIYNLDTVSMYGCDSVATLNLTILPKIDTTFIDTAICHGEYYYWSATETQYFESFSDTVVLSSTKYGCDSVVALNLHVWPEIKDTIVNDTICYGDFYVFGGDTLKGNSDITKTLPSVNGCDSTVRLILTVLDPIPVTYDTAYICYGKEPYYWKANNTEYNSSTVDTAVVPSVFGCDSVIVLTVIAVEELKTTVTDTICFGDTIEWNGMLLYETKTVNTTLQSEISGCDSVVTLNLTVLDPIKPVVTEDTICACKAPYIWRNKALTESGVYNDTVVTKYGCDSIYTLNLHVWPLIKDTIVNETICYGDFYVFGGDTLVEEVTNKAHKFTSINGCDSIVTLNLTILEAIPVTYETAYICYGKEPYYWEAKNQTYYSATTDTVVLPSVLTGCDSIVVLTLIEVPELKSTVDSTICFGDSIEWGGSYYKKNGQYDMHLQSAISGCDSVVTLNLTIRPMIEPTYTPDTICEGDTYVWYGQTYNATGEYPYTHTSIHGCDSVEILQLFVRPVVETVTYAEICSGEVYRWEGKDYTRSTNMSITYDSKITGCDSIVTLHLIVHDEIPVTVLDTAICHGTSINWLGTSYANDTIVTDTLICKHGCDSIVMLKLHIRDSIHTVVYDTICHDEPYEWNGRIYTDTITDQITLTDIYGCDSIVTLHLTVLDPILPTEDTQVACDSYEWHGDIYTASGDYTKTLTTRHGCDSVVTLHLTVKYSSYTDTAAVECDSFYWHNTGETYTESGDYTYTTVAANGCDSIVTLHLTIKKSTVGEAEQLIICYGDSIEWNGQVYKVEGDYSTILENANAVGCDSTAKMHLTILPDVQYEYYTYTTCANEPYEWFGRQLSKAGTHYDTIYNILACDSIIHVLDLTVLPIDTITKTVTACDSYTWNGETYTISGEYPYITPSLVDGCDSVTILVLTITPTVYKDTTVAACISYEWNGVVYTQSGDYTTTLTAASGCDSVVTMHLTINQPTVGDPRKEYICYGESYEWHGTTYSESGYYSIILENAVGCDSTAYLDLTVLPEMKYKYHTSYVCAGDLPYEWNNLSLTESGEYTYREQFAANASCDSIEHVLTFTVYDMSLPDTISQPIAICGKPIDLMKATDQIESYIASISHYAPNATVVWQEWIDGVWVDYDYETLKGSQSEIIIRYAIITDCGVIYSDEMVLVVEQATPENSTELDNMSVESKYGNRIFLFDLNAFSSTFGWTPTPEQVSWYKVVGEVDVYGEMGDDELVGVGHSYNLPEGEVMVGGYYAIVEQHAVSVDDCETIYRSTVIYATASGIAPKLVPNVVYPDEVLTIKNLDESQIHQILVYGASGELIATYKADKVGELMFNAANATGYYLVDIINTNGSTTLRYVVK